MHNRHTASFHWIFILDFHHVRIDPKGFLLHSSFSFSFFRPPPDFTSLLLELDLCLTFRHTIYLYLLILIVNAIFYFYFLFLFDFVFVSSRMENRFWLFWCLCLHKLNLYILNNCKFLIILWMINVFSPC